MDRVLIMLSTYNGERFLREQLESLYKQKDVDIHLLVRDDGSTDGTIGILKEYSQRYENLTILEESNIGALKSFYSLMHYASENYKDYEYYSFCDQDDVWLENKLSESIKYVTAHTNEPQLFYCLTQLVNASLQPYTAKENRIENTLGANLVSNHAAGCTQVFNYSALEKASRMYNLAMSWTKGSGYFPLHDTTMSSVCYTMGKVTVSNTPLMLYRQHGSNVIGIGDSGLKRIKTKIARYISNTRPRSTRCQILMQLYGDEMKPEAKILVEQCATYGESFTNRIRLLMNKDVYHYGIVDKIGVFCTIMLRKF